MDGASLGKGAWPFSVEMAKPEVPINLPTDTITALRYRELHVGAQGITELSMAQSHLQESWMGGGLFSLAHLHLTSHLFMGGNNHQRVNVHGRRNKNVFIYPRGIQFYPERASVVVGFHSN